jgi:CRISPR/Cas system-associated endonuclease Cas1
MLGDPRSTMRQRQFKAVLSPGKRLEIARKIVATKLRTLGLSAGEARAFQKEVGGARSIESLLVTEARAGAAYFMRWRGFEVRFRGTESSEHSSKERSPASEYKRGVAEAPQHWQTFAARAAGLIKGKGGTSKARHAASPMGAMLNYAFMVALGQCTRAAIGAGLDACHGFLHSPKPGRLSLSYDVLEFHRAAITEAVFGFVGKPFLSELHEQATFYGNAKDLAASELKRGVTRRVFKRDDFELDAHGVVRLSGPIAREIAGLALKVTPITEAAKSVRRVIGWL